MVSTLLWHSNALTTLVVHYPKAKTSPSQMNTVMSKLVTVTSSIVVALDIWMKGLHCGWAWNVQSLPSGVQTFLWETLHVVKIIIGSML